MPRLISRSSALLALALSCLPLAAQAQDDAPAAEAEPAVDVEPARKVLAAYLDAVKAKKWDVARKYIHPRTHQVLQDLRARTKGENHPMAPWARVKEQYLTKYQIVSAEPAARGSVVVATEEELFFVEDNGVEEGAPAEYLLLPLEGKWYVTDRRIGHSQFPDESVKLGYRGYFEGEFVVPKSMKEPEKKKR